MRRRKHAQQRETVLAQTWIAAPHDPGAEQWHEKIARAVRERRHERYQRQHDCNQQRPATALTQQDLGNEERQGSERQEEGMELDDGRKQQHRRTQADEQHPTDGRCTSEAGVACVQPHDASRQGRAQGREDCREPVRPETGVP